ncbi:hypothetical protein BAUCODRAFT_22864 [Baudoinia panamericana UAMH 10762]|uniref:Coenzyme Q-binding protein COQ10 START domain-containing protein n=1 Tax=Baudoinia panamericana (strain UAMH 10762) TaxID=717646 RepID=M2NGB3_BAUPA|nr:uncharacterized protein BAUCODRAFT_22864 [Baudoinia panamericana UAMH 10762]EMC98010.1 hypothetical protein BAUCODRAFT_22864 [Baudoinia panamericana UAMH 10762]
MASLASKVEIASSPARVREAFMNFSKLPEWTQGFIRSIEPIVPKEQIERGDRLKVVLEGMTINPIVLENSERQFMWRGSVWGLLYGDHYFRWEPSQTTPNATTFTHGEDFSGPLAFLIGWSGMGAKAATGFKKFNEDLKRHAESQA